MKLYYAPGACSLSPHIVLREAGIAADIEKVDLREKKTASGEDFTKVNPKGYVPALKLDDGRVLTEGVAIVQYLADQKPDSGLVPKAGSLERYTQQEWLTFISSEVHKQFSPLFNPKAGDEWKQFCRDRLAMRFDYISGQMDGKAWLTGDKFTAADAYLFTVLNWHKRVEIDLARWPVLQKYLERVVARPKVQEAMKAEGLLK
jgi:glutathione S-transferase